jgi:hypothetical protein
MLRVYRTTISKPPIGGDMLNTGRRGALLTQARCIGAAILT